MAKHIGEVVRVHGLCLIFSRLHHFLRNSRFARPFLAQAGASLARLGKGCGLGWATLLQVLTSRPYRPHVV